MPASLSLFEKEHAAREKYIYFICGVAGALVAYLGKGYAPVHPLTVHDKIIISTLMCLIAAFLFGIGRILSYIQGISLNKDVLRAREEIENLVNAKRFHLEHKNEIERVPVHLDMTSGKPCSPDEIEARISDLKVSSERDSARMKVWFDCSSVLFVICHAFLILGFVLMVCATFIA